MPKQKDEHETRVAIRVGLNLRELREERRVPPSDIASLLGVSERTVNAYELGARRISLADFARLCDYFGVPPSRLLTGRPQPLSAAD
jgi:transcriptional regulator with XRE-family HTH domain